MRRERTDYIFVHCSATPAHMDIGAAEIDEWHKARSWSGIGYHRVIKRDGSVENGRDLDQQGAHVKGYNDQSIGVCLIGGVDAEGKPIFNFTRAQMSSLRVVVSGLRRGYLSATVKGHRDVDHGKACPCFDVALWAEEELF